MSGFIQLEQIPHVQWFRWDQRVPLYVVALAKADPGSFIAEVITNIISRITHHSVYHLCLHMFICHYVGLYGYPGFKEGKEFKKLWEAKAWKTDRDARVSALITYGPKPSDREEATMVGPRI